MPGTVNLHRVFAAKPEKLFKAFTDPDAKCRWLPPYGFVGKMHSHEAKVGGAYKMSFINFSTGNGHSFGGTFKELSPTRIRYTDTFDDPNMPGEMEVTVTLKPVVVGAEVSIEQAGVPDMIPLAACYLGWQQSLEQLAKLVEPEIPD